MRTTPGRRAQVLAVFLVGTLSGGAVFAQDAALPPRPPKVAWLKTRVRAVEIAAADAALAAIPTHPLTPNEDGRFLFGPTPGYQVAIGERGVVLTPWAAQGKKPKATTLTAPGRLKLPLAPGPGAPIAVAVEFLQDEEGWKYRIPVFLEVASEAGTVCFVDADGDGWFDDLDADRVAVGDAKQKDRLEFRPFDGEVLLRDTRHLAYADLREAGLWPVSKEVRRDYVRHVAEVNAVRRFGGLPRVGLAEELIPLCEAHSRYCARNGLGHEEDRRKPEYTPGGNYAGLHSNVGRGRDAVESAAELLRTLWHRNFYYTRALTRVGVGWGDGSVTSDVLTHGGGTARDLTFAPPDRSLDAPLQGANENPDPYPVERRPGPFVTVLLPPGRGMKFKEGSITPRGGGPLAFDVSDPTAPPARARARFPDNDGCIVLIPHEALAPETIYDVSVTALGGNKPETFRWSFRTGAARSR